MLLRLYENQWEDVLKSGSVFPVRLLGFGLYWGWLFLSTLSPSPLMENQLYLGLPLEGFELIFRLIAVFFIILFAKLLSTNAGKHTLLLIGLIAGPVSTIGLGLTGTFVFVIVAALADAVIFILWLCFFGYMKTGETAPYMALSYAVGALIAIAVPFLSLIPALVTTAFLPALSIAMFVLSNQLYSQTTGAPPVFSEKSVPLSDANSPFPYIGRLALALCCYALLFALPTCTNLMSLQAVSIAGPYIEAPCCLAIGLFISLAIKRPRILGNIQNMYKIVPLVFAIGYVLLLISNARLFIVASTFIMLGYISFEINALNDFCNAVRAQKLSMIRTFGIARLAITGGMLTGWILGSCSRYLPKDISAIQCEVALAFIVLVIVTSLVFTEKEFFAIKGVADARSAEESSGSTGESSPSEEKIIIEFAKEWHLSNRETEVLDPLLKGRSAQYIADQLFIAPGTVKSHIYNIYQKMGIHSKMELLDTYEAFLDEAHNKT